MEASELESVGLAEAGLAETQERRAHRGLGGRHCTAWVVRVCDHAGSDPQDRLHSGDCSVGPSMAR